MNSEKNDQIECAQCAALKKTRADLLAACESMLFSFDEIVQQEGYQTALKRFCEAKRAVRLAIAKAKGERNED